MTTSDSTSLLVIAILSYFGWRYIFSKQAIIKAALHIKLIHALIYLFISYIGVMALPRLIWILGNSAQWMEFLRNSHFYFPTQVNMLEQAIELVVLPLGAVCMHLLIRGAKNARKFLLMLLPVICLLFCFNMVEISWQHYGVFDIRGLILLGIVATIFLAMFLFYFSPSVTKALFPEQKSNQI